LANQSPTAALDGYRDTGPTKNVELNGLKELIGRRVQQESAHPIPVRATTVRRTRSVTIAMPDRSISTSTIAYQIGSEPAAARRGRSDSFAAFPGCRKPVIRDYAGSDR
jgi:hypothetical protein